MPQFSQQVPTQSCHLRRSTGAVP